MGEVARCVSCGADVPDRDSPPYSAHAADCALVRQWVACRVPSRSFGDRRVLVVIDQPTFEEERRDRVADALAAVSGCDPVEL